MHLWSIASGCKLDFIFIVYILDVSAGPIHHYDPFVFPKRPSKHRSIKPPAICESLKIYLSHLYDSLTKGEFPEDFSIPSMSTELSRVYNSLNTRLVPVEGSMEVEVKVETGILQVSILFAYLWCKHEILYTQEMRRWLKSVVKQIQINTESKHPADLLQQPFMVSSVAIVYCFYKLGKLQLSKQKIQKYFTPLLKLLRVERAADGSYPGYQRLCRYIKPEKCR